MKFLKANKQKTPPPHLSVTNLYPLENFIEGTKCLVDKELKKALSKPTAPNITRKDHRAISRLRRSYQITIKPADKNLGIVVLNSSDYVDQCLVHLSSDTYIRINHFPTNQIKQAIENTLICFKTHLTPHKHLHDFLKSRHDHLIPAFYGLPKIHKPLNEQGIPPIRPIISHSNSLLSHTASFIDYVLQPLAQSYDDFLKNSTGLVTELNNSTFPSDIILVTLDVVNLYPSIPQGECINIIHEEMFKFQELILFDPNLITHLLHTNMTNNFFQFAGCTFLQQKGTAMGAAFSPSIANIFMSVLLRKFLALTSEKPTFIKRYIDDIIMLWPQHQNLTNFINSLNNYHQNIKFTVNYSNTSVNFLDLTVYKGDLFNRTNKLDVKTYEKNGNLYQYVHFTSNHPKHNLRGIIIGEATRYVRTNSSENTYLEQLEKFTSRLVKRSYPHRFINKALRKVHYKNRDRYIETQCKPLPKPLTRPVFKCVPPPNFQMLKVIILREFSSHNISRYTDTPLFVTLRNTTLKDILINRNHTPTDTDVAKITENSNYAGSHHQYNLTLPDRKNTKKPHPCCNPRCATCHHFNPSNHFVSTSTKQCFNINKAFSCDSKQIIYLITCTKCNKQYVGRTYKTLRERISQHRSSIKVNQDRYISKHFNLAGHNITHLTVQVIDGADRTNPDQLQELEKFWIQCLNTIQPKGLNINTE